MSNRDLAVQEGEAKVKSARDLEERLHVKLVEAEKREVPIITLKHRYLHADALISNRGELLYYF